MRAGSQYKNPWVVSNLKAVASFPAKPSNWLGRSELRDQFLFWQKIQNHWSGSRVNGVHLDSTGTITYCRFKYFLEYLVNKIQWIIIALNILTFFTSVFNLSSSSFSDLSCYQSYHILADSISVCTDLVL